MNPFHKGAACSLCKLACSVKSGRLKQVEEWAFLLRSWVGKLSFVEITLVPELKPVEIVRAHLNVIIHTSMLEEQLLVTPVRANRVRSAHYPAYESFFATELGRLIEGKHLEHGGVDRNDRHLVLKVILVLVSPAIDVVRFNIQLVGPVRIFFFIAVLVKLGDFHD